MNLVVRITAIRISFRSKLFIIFTLLTALLTAIFTILYISSEIEEKHAAYGEKAQIMAKNLAANARLPLYAENRELLMDLIHDAMQHPDVHRVVFSTRDGRVLADSNRQTVNTNQELINKTEEVYSAPHEDTDINKPNHTLVGNVQLKLAPSELQHLTRNTVIKAASLSVAFWLMVAALTYLGLRRATRSFNALMQGIETMRIGNFTARIDVASDDEPGRAALAINELAATLHERDLENSRLHEELINALRMEVQAEKKQLMAKLIQTNRMTSLGLLASSMAHEINNPNGSIRLANQYMIRACKDALPLLQQLANDEGDFCLGGVPFSSARDALVDCGATIDRSTERISHVIQDLRSYSLGERNELMHDVDIKQVISGALTIVRSHGKYSGMTLVNATQGDLPPVSGSRHQLEQVLINLLLNAIQATPDGKGVVTAYAECDRDSDQVRIMVKDQGEGILPENMIQLLEPFFSTRIEQGGSGLGLFVTSFIIREHNGRIEFNSAPGVGTTVTIHLPISHNPLQV